MLAYLRLHGIKAREHPVFTELTRVKQYFDKIKMTETPPSTTRTKTVDKAVARRFLEPDLVCFSVPNFYKSPIFLELKPDSSFHVLLLLILLSVHLC